MSDLIPKGYTKDLESGYLVANNPRGSTPFGIDTKKRILQLMREEGSISIICEKLGVSTRSVYDHLNIDEAFRRDYALCVRDNCSELEGTMFKNGKRPQGYMDRITYLRRWAPNEWTPKTNVTVNRDDSSVDALFASLKEQGKIIDVNPEP